MSPEEQQRIARAQKRLSSGYPGGIVQCGEAKPSLYEQLSPVERMEALWQLCRTQWLLSGQVLPVYTRAQAPGEIFEIRLAAE